MNIHLYEPFETKFNKNFKNSKFNLEDISIFTILKQRFPNYEKDVNAWIWLESILPDENSQKKIRFIIENWSEKLIEDIANL